VKIQQLRFLAAVAQNDLNITAAAAKLCTTQPAVSGSNCREVKKKVMRTRI
jgi:DNA-binding transcriptional LysR family regulator